MPRWTRLTDVHCISIGAIDDLGTASDCRDPDAKGVKYLMLATENQYAEPCVV